MVTPILWQDEAGTVTLLDVPASIVAAQGADVADMLELLSSEPLQRPFSSTEPKTSSIAKGQKLDPADAEVHARYQQSLTTALEAVRSQHDGPWCLPRSYAPPVPATRQAHASQKRSCDDDASIDEASAKGRSFRSVISLSDNQSDRRSSDGVSDLCEDCLAFGPTYQGNCTGSVKRLTVNHHRVRVPAGSYFVQGDCAEARSLHAAVRAQAAAHDTSRHFDLVLLDPPWPNRSVRRTHKTPSAQGRYRIAATLPDIRRLLLRTDLDMLLHDDSVVGAWITNKPAVRDLVLGENGLFAAWGLQLLEEWIWLKVTAQGYPVTALGGIWRRPYEVLLVGRRNRSSAADLRDAAVPIRTIVGVPDLHSRKPCLKPLFEQFLLPRLEGPRMLEVFARHLVAGWWSWGDECTLFNREECWAAQEQRPEIPGE